jgi:hypothetical protein
MVGPSLAAALVVVKIVGDNDLASGVSKSPVKDSRNYFLDVEFVVGHSPQACGTVGVSGRSPRENPPE